MDVKRVVPPGGPPILGHARPAGLYRIDAGGRALTMAGFSATHAVEQARSVLLTEWGALFTDPVTLPASGIGYDDEPSEDSEGGNDD